MRYFFSVCFSLICILPIDAGISIPMKYRVKNFSPGYCSWCCIEMLAYHQKISSLYGLARKRAEEGSYELQDGKKVFVNYVTLQTEDGNLYREHVSPGTKIALTTKLDSLGVKYKIQDYEDYSTSLIENSLKNNIGCCVVVKPGCFTTESGYHAVILIDFNAEDVVFVDPNDISKNWYAKRRWFDYWCAGFVLILNNK